MSFQSSIKRGDFEGKTGHLRRSKIEVDGENVTEGEESGMVNVRMLTPDDISPQRQPYSMHPTQKHSLNNTAALGHSSSMASGVGFHSLSNRGPLINDMSRERRSPENFHPPRTPINESCSYNVEITEIATKAVKLAPNMTAQM